MKNLIAPKFIILSILAFSLLVIPTAETRANYQVGWQGDTYVGQQVYTPPVNNNNVVVNPTPVVTYVSPNSVPRNSYQTITVSGYNFVQGSVIRINGTDLMTTYLNSGTLTTELNPSALQYSTHYSVAVFNPSPAGGISNQMAFTIKDNTNYSYGTTTNSKTTNNAVSNQTSNSNYSNTNTTNDTSATTKDLAASAIFGTNAFMPSSLLQWIFFFILILLGIILWRRLYVSEEEKRMPLKHA